MRILPGWQIFSRLPFLIERRLVTRESDASHTRVCPRAARGWFFARCSREFLEPWLFRLGDIIIQTKPSYLPLTNRTFKILPSFFKPLRFCAWSTTICFLSFNNLMKTEDSPRAVSKTLNAVSCKIDDKLNLYLW